MKTSFNNFVIKTFQYVMYNAERIDIVRKCKNNIK